VPKSLWVTDDAGDRLFELEALQGRGLENRTTWCFWETDFSPTGYLGDDVLLSGNAPK
jgi:hypothetical protein